VTKNAQTSFPRIAMLGAGSMATAILSGLLSPLVNCDGPIRVTNRSAASASRFSSEPRVIAWSTEENPQANVRAVEDARIVILAVKPAMITNLLDEISPVLAPGTIVVSVAGGITTGTMKAHLPETVRVIRTMPNTPAKVGKAVTGICAGHEVPQADMDLITQLFSTVGEVITLDESQIDALGALSGSGPAYVYYMIEKLTTVALEHGFTPEQAKVMIQGTFDGALDLLEATGEEPAELRRQVTSPKGSTERAIAVFDHDDMTETFRTAIAAAIARSEEMAKGQ
jgi:pyrroline-5-carboxylate reductase